MKGVGYDVELGKGRLNGRIKSFSFCIVDILFFLPTIIFSLFCCFVNILLLTLLLFQKKKLNKEKNGNGTYVRKKLMLELTLDIVCSSIFIGKVFEDYWIC